MNQVDYSLEAEKHPFRTMINASDFFLKNANSNENGSFLNCLASLVFAAFTLEAFTNSVGQTLYKCWGKNIEKRLSVSDKITLITEHLEIETDFSKMPWQDIKVLMRFRNQIAHPKPETLTDEGTIPHEEYEKKRITMIEADWEQFCTKENAEKKIKCVDDIIKKILSHENFEATDFINKQTISATFK